MTWLESFYTPLIAVGIGFHFGVAWALLARYIQSRDGFLLHWGVGWVQLSIYVLAMLLVQITGHPAVNVVQHMAYIGASGAFLIGQAMHQETRFPLANLAMPAIVAMAITPVAAWVGFSLGGTVAVEVTALPLVVGAGWSFGYAAWLAWPRERTADTGAWLLFASFALGGLHALLYPFFADWPGKLLFHIGASAVFSLLFAAAVIWQTLERVRGIRLFRRIVDALNRPLGMQEALDEALKLVMELFNLPLGWILLRQEGRGGAEGTWTIAAARGFAGWATHGVQQRDFPIDTCLCLRSVERDEVTGTINVLDCVRMSELNRRPAGRHATVPLGAGGQVVGLMNLGLPKGRSLNTSDLQLLTALGEQIGLAMERARLYDDLRENEAARGELLSRLIGAQEDERRRIARELHDGVGQALTALVVNLDMMSRPGTGNDGTAARLRQLKDLAEMTLGDIRRVMHDLRPTILDDLGLAAALRWLVTNTLEPTGLTVTLELHHLEDRLPNALETAIFRMVQEATNNVVKHASARHLSIRVRRQADSVRLEVADDGVGLSQPPARPRQQPGQGGMGLASIKERVRQAGGTWDIDSSPDWGTRISVWLPVPAPHPAPSAVTV